MTTSATKTTSQLLEDARKTMKSKLESIKTNYKNYLQEERTRITQSVEDLKSVLEAEFGDSLEVNETALAILMSSYKDDTEIVEEVTQ